MLHIVALLFFATVAALWWFHAANQEKLRAAFAANRGVSRRYHCVEVTAGSEACEAAKKLGNERFLYAEAPSLPVTGCTAATCTCGYMHHADRREARHRDASAFNKGYPFETVGVRRSRRMQKQLLASMTVRRYGTDRTAMLIPGAFKNHTLN